MDNKKKESKGINFFSSPQFNQEGNLEWGQLIQKTIALIAFFVVIYSLALYFIKDSYHDIGAWVTQKMGLAGGRSILSSPLSLAGTPTPFY